ncbi:hypothetical protein Tco_0661107 [Tanacetum coccineum]
MKQDKAQQAARDEKLVPTEDRVKIGKSNFRMDPTLTQKEETYQVILDIIKNTPCYTAFLITADIFNIKLKTDSQRSEDVRSCPIIGSPKPSYTTSCVNTNLFPRGKGTKATVIPKKATSASKKKGPKKKVSIRDKLASVQADFSTNLVAQVKELVLDQRFQMSQQKNLQTQMKELVLHQRFWMSQKIKGEAQDAFKDWGSTNDETFLFDDKDEIIKDIPRVSTDDDETKDDDEEDDVSIDIEKTGDERTNTDVEDQVKGVAEINIAKEAEEEIAEEVDKQKADEELKADEEQQGDKQVGNEQVGVLVSTTHKDKPNLLQSTSSYSISSNFGNQFLNSPNVSLIEPFHAVKVSVIPEPSQILLTTPPAPPLPASVIPSALVPSSKALNDAIQRVFELEKDDDVSKFIKVNQEHAAQEKIPKYSTTPHDQAVDDEHKQKEILFKMMMASKSHEKHPSHKDLYDTLIQSLHVDENDIDRLAVNPDS